jgi:4-hydroxy-tetrahydrodipicolinate synthase
MLNFPNNKLDRKFFPAISTIFQRINGKIQLDLAAGEAYIEGIFSQPISGVATLVHTGRGNFLTPDERKSWLQLVGTKCKKNNKLLVVGVSNPDQAQQAKDAGADMLLVFPNRSSLEGLNDPDRAMKIVKYHKKIAEFEIPLCLFLLYEETGIGINYSSTEIEELFKIPQVVGIKSALLSNFEKFEDLTLIISQVKPAKVLLTGEDRMFGESLDKIRDLQIINSQSSQKIPIGALVGMGQALIYLQTFMLKYFDNIEVSEDYYHARAIISEFARATFIHPKNTEGKIDYNAPMEPYVLNMLYASMIQFKLSEENLIDIVCDEVEVKARNIPTLTHNAAKNALTNDKKKEIRLIVEKGMKFEADLRSKYGDLE